MPHANDLIQLMDNKEVLNNYYAWARLACDKYVEQMRIIKIALTRNWTPQTWERLATREQNCHCEEEALWAVAEVYRVEAINRGILVEHFR